VKGDATKHVTLPNKPKPMRVFFSLLLSLYFYSASAQTSLNEALKQQMLKDWQRAKDYTQEYLDAMPSAQYSFHAVDSIRSFAQQMLHLAFANVALVYVGTSSHDSVIRKMYLQRDLEHSATAQSSDSVAFFVRTSYDFVLSAIKLSDFANLTELVTQRTAGGVRTEQRLAWMMKAFEHQTHHRGQCTIYIRLLGIRPPAEKLF
jgi:uncharacterized damage-inducible protein DinB